MLKIASLTTGLLAAGLFLTPLPASAAQIGVGAIPEATTTVETVQYGYGGYGRPHYGRRFTAVGASATADISRRPPLRPRLRLWSRLRPRLRLWTSRVLVNREPR